MPPPCEQICTDKPIGYECTCKPGFEINKNYPSLCVDIDECKSRPCSQICRNTFGSYFCTCSPGYFLLSDNRTCHANTSVPAKLIIANRYYIREYDLNGRHSSILVHNLTNAVALDYDWENQCLYWSDVTHLGSTIKSLCNYTNANATPSVIHSATLQNPDGLAIDWVAGNLYWCDKVSCLFYT